MNTASRLEALTKDYDCELVVSDETVARPGLDFSEFPYFQIEIRGKREMLAVTTFNRAADLPSPGAIRFVIASRLCPRRSAGRPR